MPFGTSYRSLRDGVLVIKDGTGSPLTVTVACAEGDLSWTQTKEYREQWCRDTLTGKREGRQQGCEVSFSLKVDHLISYTDNSSDPVTPYEILDNTGSAFTTTAARGDHYAVTLQFTVSDPDAGNSGTDEVITFTTFAPESIQFQEGDDNMLTVSGKCLETRPTIARA